MLAARRHPTRRRARAQHLGDGAHCTAQPRRGPRPARPPHTPVSPHGAQADDRSSLSGPPITDPPRVHRCRPSHEPNKPLAESHAAHAGAGPVERPTARSRSAAACGIRELGQVGGAKRRRVFGTESPTVIVDLAVYPVRHAPPGQLTSTTRSSLARSRRRHLRVDRAARADPGGVRPGAAEFELHPWRSRTPSTPTSVRSSSIYGDCLFLVFQDGPLRRRGRGRSSSPRSSCSWATASSSPSATARPARWPGAPQLEKDARAPGLWAHRRGARHPRPGGRRLHAGARRPRPRHQRDRGRGVLGRAHHPAERIYKLGARCSTCTATSSR